MQVILFSFSSPGKNDQGDDLNCDLNRATRFPDLDASNSLRWIQATNLPDHYRRIEFGLDANLNTILNSGSPILNVKASAKQVKTIQLEFSGASVEFLDEFSFHNYYKNRMSSACKNLLNRYPFVGQGLRIESMKLIFKDELGSAINLTANLPQIVDISADVRWRIENNQSLIIDTPKYIGYRMAKMVMNSGKPEIQYASTATKDGQWQFQSIDTKKMRFDSKGEVTIAELLGTIP